MRCFGVQYRCRFLLVLRILTHPVGSSKYGRTRKNVQRYCTLKHPIRYIYFTLIIRPVFNETLHNVVVPDSIYVARYCSKTTKDKQ